MEQQLNSPNTFSRYTLFSDRCSSAARAEQDYYHSVYWWDQDLERSQVGVWESGTETSRYHLLLDVHHCGQHGVSQSLAGSACRVRCDEALRGWGIILLFLTSCFTVFPNQNFSLVVSLMWRKKCVCLGPILPRNKIYLCSLKQRFPETRPRALCAHLCTFSYAC